MGNIMKIDSENFENLLATLESDTKKIEEKFNNINNLMNEVNDEIWSGKTANKLKEKYLSIYNKFPEITNQLNNYNTFLKHTIENYKMLEQNINKSINNNNENLTVTGD